MQRHEDTMLARRERPVQARSLKTQEKLLRAAADLLVDRGYGGWRFADVAAQAGVSPGALTHHFPDKAALLIALAKMTCDRATAKGIAAARDATDPSRAVADLMKALRDAYFTADYEALREIGNAVHSNRAIFPKIEPHLAEYRVRINEEWRATFESFGFPADRVRNAIAISVNMVRGMAAHAVWRPDRASADAVIAAWADIGQRYLDGEAAFLPKAGPAAGNV